MTTVTATIADFLLARLAEDEAVAKAVPPPMSEREPFSLRFESYESDHSREDSAFVERFDPARVLADIEAKRRIVEQARDYSPELEYGDNGEWAFDLTLRALAQPYRDHPEWREEWDL